VLAHQSWAAADTVLLRMYLKKGVILMKRMFLVIMLVLFAALSLSLSPAIAGSEQSPIYLTLNNSSVDFGDQGPYIDQVTGRTMLPLRATVELMGAIVNWDESKNTATIKKDQTTILIQIGSNSPIVNGETKYMDAPALIVNGRTMVPVRFISEQMGAKVEWDSANNSVNIYANAAATPPVQTAPPEINNGLLPNENKIQRSLTQEDIQRLQNYPISDVAQADLDKYPAVQATYVKDFQKYRYDRRPLYMQALKILADDISTFDYEKFRDQAYAENYVNNFYKVTIKSDYNEKLINNYIADKVACKLKIKAYFLSSEQLVYQASPNYTVARTKYIFYQESGTKIEEEGSALGQWYWEDVEFLFVTPLGKWEGNTTDVGYYTYVKLNSPQPINLN